jgi:hypothetical protein
MGSNVWKRGVRHKVLEKPRMNKKSVKVQLRSAERGGVMECRMKWRRAESGGCRSAQ